MSALLEVRDLAVELPGASRPVLDGASFALAAGECVAIVGESGSGKTTLLRACLGLLPEGARVARGSIRYLGGEMLGSPPERWRAVRGAGIAWIPQEPAAALHPILRVGSQVSETLVIHGLARGAEASARAAAALAEVGLPNAQALLAEVPHRLSGGMRQRVAIAAALAARPKVVLADEPTTALDASLRAIVLDLLDRLRRETGLGVLLVSHDRRAVERRAGRVLRLEGGRLAT